MIDHLICVFISLSQCLCVDRKHQHIKYTQEKKRNITKEKEFSKLKSIHRKGGKKEKANIGEFGKLTY